MNNLMILTEVQNELKKKNADIVFRHPWVNLFYNWVIGILLVALSVSLYGWALDLWAQRRADTQTGLALAAWQQEQAEQETLRLAAIAEQQAAEEYSLKKMSTALAKVLYGADKFRDKYHYTDDDFRTLCRCVTNRVENPAYSDSIYEVIDQPEQWVGYYPTNPVLDDYYGIAYDFLEAWIHEEVKPCSNSFLWAEFTPNGIFLKDDFHADGYARRYHV